MGGVRNLSALLLARKFQESVSRRRLLIGLLSSTQRLVIKCSLPYYKSHLGDELAWLCFLSHFATFELGVVLPVTFTLGQ